MAKKAQEKIKQEKYVSEEQEEIIRFVRILIIVIVAVLLVYLFTRLFVTKDLGKTNNEVEPVAGEIDYTSTLIGNMFNKNEDEYYVIIYDSESLKANYYNGMKTNYERNTDHLTVYYADLNNGLNSKYYTEGTPNITTDFNTLKVGDLTLIKVKSGKITKSLIDEEAINKELAYQNES